MSPPLPLLQTPCLLLDEGKMAANINRLSAHARSLGVALRPHLKTAKSLPVAERVFAQDPPKATVSTLAEAEAFAAAGVADIIYAVGISPAKLERVRALRAKGCDLAVILDSIEQAEMLAQAAHEAGTPIPALIEIDSDGHRGGVTHDDPALLAIGAILHQAQCLRGVLTHAGESYTAVGKEAHAAFAERERAAVAMAAERLRAQGLPCPVVSMGSTPTAHAAANLAGITELRAGVYMFFDLVMAGIGVCAVEDIALTVLTTVIGHQATRGWIMVDAGWMALSRDRGTAAQAVDQGYGLVCDETGTVIPDLIVGQANQEHGVIMRRAGSSRSIPEIPLGARLRILPNHACATAAQHGLYHVVPASGGPLLEWPRFGGW